MIIYNYVTRVPEFVYASRRWRLYNAEIAIALRTHEQFSANQTCPKGMVELPF